MIFLASSAKFHIHMKAADLQSLQALYHEIYGLRIRLNRVKDDAKKINDDSFEDLSTVEAEFSTTNNALFKASEEIRGILSKHGVKV